MKIVRKIANLLLALSLAVSLTACSPNNIQPEDFETVDTDSTSTTEKDSYLDKVEIKDTRIQKEDVVVYETVKEKGIVCSSVEEYKKLYEELDIQRQELEKEYRYAYENYLNYTGEAIGQLGINCAKIYYDMVFLFSPQFSEVKNLPEETVQDIELKLETLTQFNETFSTFAKNRQSCERVYTSSLEKHIFGEDANTLNTIYLYVNLIESIYRNPTMVTPRKEIERLTIKLDNLKNLDFNV